MEGCNVRSRVSPGTGHRSLLGNMVYSYPVDYNLLCRRVHSHWADYHRKRGLADEISYAPCILMMIFSAWLLPEKNSVAFYLSTLACLAVIIALLITLIVEVPIDNQIRTWTATTMPSDWTMIRARWERFHTARTFVSLGSLASFIVAVLISKKLT